MEKNHCRKREGRKGKTEKTKKNYTLERNEEVKVYVKKKSEQRQKVTNKIIK